VSRFNRILTHFGYSPLGRSHIIYWYMQITRFFSHGHWTILWLQQMVWIWSLGNSL